jgi:hypothetical protein
MVTTAIVMTDPRNPHALPLLKAMNTMSSHHAENVTGMPRTVKACHS